VGTVVFFEGFFTFFVGLASFADIVIAFYMYELYVRAPRGQQAFICACLQQRVGGSTAS